MVFTFRKTFHLFLIIATIKFPVISHQHGFKQTLNTLCFAQHLPPNHKILQQSKASERTVAMPLDMSKVLTH